MEEAVGGVEGGAAPHLQREGVRQDVRRALGALHHVPGAHPGGEEALVGVPHGGVRDEELFLVQDPLLHGLGALGVQQMLEAHLRRDLAPGLREAGGIVLGPLGVRVIHLNVCDVAQDPGGTVPGVRDVEELRAVVDELGVALALEEGGVVQDVGEEGDVGLHAPDVDLADGPGRPAADAGEGVVPGGDLHEKGIVVGGDDGAGGGVAAVQPDAEAAAAAVHGDAAVVGGEVVLGVLGGNPALDGVAVDVQILLIRQTDVRAAEGIALGDEDLGPDQVDARHHLRDGVLHLNAGVHLNEVVIAIGVHQELHGAGANVAHAFRDLHGVGAELLPGLLRDGPGGGHLHHLLVAALQGAVPLPQVHHAAVLVAQDLDLDVLGFHDELLDEDVVVAEGLLGLALHQLKGGLHLLGRVAAAHAPAAAATGGLQDHREAEAHGLLQRLVPVPQRLGAAGDDGHPAADGDLLGGQLVAHPGHGVGLGADEGDARLLAGPDEVRVLGEEAVAGVDGVHAPALGQVDDLADVQVGPQGAVLLADEVGLVGLGAEEAQGILLGVHGHGVEPQVIAGPEDADGDLAPVGGEDFLKAACWHGRSLFSR